MKAILLASYLVFFSATMSGAAEVEKRSLKEVLEEIKSVKVVEEHLDPIKLYESYLVIEMKGVYNASISDTEPILVDLQGEGRRGGLDVTTIVKTGKIYLPRPAADPIAITSGFGNGYNPKDFTVRFKLHPSSTEHTNRSIFYVTFEYYKKDPIPHTRLRGFQATLYKTLKKWHFEEIDHAKF